MDIFKNDAQITGGLFLYSKNTSLLVIKECIKQKVNILGIDGFYVKNGKTIPSMENSLDVSYESNTEIKYDHLIETVKNAGDDCLFEIILAD